MSSLKGRVSIVTGGASGIGREIALRLARDNGSVVICDIDDKKAEQTAAEVRALGSKSLAVKCDVSRSADVRHAIEKTLTEFGQLEILINNAGIGYATGSVVDPTHALIENLTEEEWDRVVNINLKSVFLFSREVAPIMKRQRWGKIVSISSVAGITGHGIGGGSGPAYGASKAGIINLTKTLARQLGPYNVNVNCVAPGSVPETAFTMSEEEIANELAVLPLKRMGRTLDIAEAVIFLCSAAAQWITGQTLNVNGGEVM
ncbi:MAG: SDR family NAD(P)-dependent oxidoreductase [Candidatus Bathyarchaeia archaeon]